MHLQIIHQAFVTPQEGGGTRHYEFARYLAKRGHMVTVVASDVNYLTGKSIVKEKGVVRNQESDGVHLLRVRTLATLHKNFLWRVISFINFMLLAIWAGLKNDKVSVVMGTTPPLFQAFSSWVVAFLRRKPFLLEIRDLWPEFAIGMGVLKNKWLIAASRSLEYFLYRRSEHVVVNSPAYRKYLFEKGIPFEKITLVSNGVDPNMFYPEKTGKTFRRDWTLNDKFLVTYAGALGMANDIKIILEAAAMLSDQKGLHFLIVGDGKEKINLENLAEQMDLHNVTFTGFQPKELMPQILSASDVCLATLMNISVFRMTYPNKVFDYMAAGRPTVLNIDGVIRDVIEASGGGMFVKPGDASLLAGAIHFLFHNPEIGKTMGKSARKYVEVHFNRNKQAESFLKVVEKIASR